MLKKSMRFLLRTVAYLFVASLVYTVICRWVFPPITITQIVSVIEGHGLSRDYVSWDKISPEVKLAAIASEDQLFPSHNGFDWKAIEKSIEKNKAGHQKGAAASTISQQTAKNVFLWQGHGNAKYIRKGFEFIYTYAIELVWGKKRILEVYLNVAEMGPGIFGIEAAAQKYFNKPAKKLNSKEAAMIVACMPNPKKFTVRPLSRRVQWRYPNIQRQMNNMKSYPAVKELVYK